MTLPEIHRIIAGERKTYTDHPKEKQDEWLRALKEYQADRDVQKRRNRKGEEIDHAHTVNNIASEVCRQQPIVQLADTL